MLRKHNTLTSINNALPFGDVKLAWNAVFSALARLAFTLLRSFPYHTGDSQHAATAAF